ncbi:MAG: tRNA lysidine(34) synthetase TilS [Candidatus Izemoplasmatales bacterium]|nr:tRNA lysidine(34) synthetase TilS [Candidatus Izemoplasmatales bacterium]
MPLLNLNLIKKNDVIVIAVSGGIDSMVLLDAICRLKNDLNLTIIVAHVNHRMRLESEAEYTFVENKCQSYNVAFYGMTLDYQGEENFHNFSRNKRYQFFYEIAVKVNATKIALAHHADDQAETILMRLVRGSGFIGYAGISERINYHDLEIIRPLLHTTKAEIDKYQIEHQLEFRQDASNFQDKYTRNRFRHHLMPLIEQENPLYHDKFAQFSTYISEAYQLISRLSILFIDTSVSFIQDKASVVVAEIAALDRAVARDVIKRTIDRLTNNSLELTYTNFEDVLNVITGNKPNARITLNQKLRVIRKYDCLSFEPIILDTLSFSQIISTFGTYPLPNGDTVTVTEKRSDIDGISIELWYNNLRFIFPMTFRSRQDGDRIKLTGGTKKVSELLIDLKIPLDDRNRLAIGINPQGEIFWIPGIKISPVTKIGDQVIYLTYAKGK